MKPSSTQTSLPALSLQQSFVLVEALLCQEKNFDRLYQELVEAFSEGFSCQELGYLLTSHAERVLENEGEQRSQDAKASRKYGVS